MNTLQTYTLQSLLTGSADAFSNRPALSFVDANPYTYKDVNILSRKIAAFLTLHNITKGDKVALLSENKPNWGVVFFSLSWIGAVAVPILTDFHTDEILKILKHSESKAIFVSGKQREKLSAIMDEKIKVFDIDDIDLNNIQIDDFIPNSTEESDLASIIYTSGTSGMPKGVMLTNKNIVFNAYQGSKVQEIDSNDRMLSILPLSHAYENTIGFLLPLLKGACVYYLEKPPTVSVLVPALQKVKPTLILSVPLVIEKIFKARIKPKFSKGFMGILYKNTFFRKRLNQAAGKKLYKTFGGKLKFFGIGGAKLSDETEFFLREAGFPYAIGYGLTETAPLLAGSNPAQTRFQSTGTPIFGVEMRINNPDPISGEGEILVKGDNIMPGYFKNAEMTDEVFTEDGWFRTGDLGTMDKEGYLYIMGRLKNMIVGPNGENIYPEEIEAVINKFDHVLESLVLEEKGQLVALVHFNKEELELKIQNLKESAEQLQEHLTEYLKDLKDNINLKLNKYSKIKLVVQKHEPFERTPTQKIKRYVYKSL